MELLILGPQDVRELLPMRECIDVMERALRALARGESVQPLRSILWTPNRHGALGQMPAFEGSTGMLGSKVVTVFPGNHGTELDAHQGVVLLFEGERGSPIAMLDGSEVTAIRTAAVSGLATRTLARPDARVLAVLGAGIQARTHIDAMRAVRAFAEIRIWNRTRAAAERLAAGTADVTVVVCDTAEAAVRGADVVCTTTSAREPVLRGAWLDEGCHINAVGSSVKSTRELDAEAMKRCRIYVDRRESTLAESGDFLIAREEGAVSDADIVAEVGEVLEDPARGRGGADEVTLFKSLGLGVEDVAAAQHVYAAARKAGKGHRVPWGGARDAD